MLRGRKVAGLFVFRDDVGCDEVRLAIRFARPRGVAALGRDSACVPDAAYEIGPNPCGFHPSPDLIDLSLGVIRAIAIG